MTEVGEATSPVWHVYLIECVDGTLYTGVSTDVQRRFEQHRAGKGARYTRSHKPQRLLASSPVGTRSEAQRIELAIKKLPRENKIAAVLSPSTLAASSK
jgi:putative endonuclease